MKLALKSRKLSRLLKTISLLVIIGVVSLLTIAFLSKGSVVSQHHTQLDTMPMVDTALKTSFTKLSNAHTDVCRDIGDLPAIEKYMASLPSGSRLQGSCCSPMDIKHYVSQINSLRAYANIPEIPTNPYDVSKASAEQMLGFYNNIQLTPAQQSIYDQAQKMTADHGWCCCKCWAWYTHARLAKYLITQHDFTTQQIVAVTNLEDCCGGA